MKLRIKGNSLRLRISPSEMSSLLRSGRIAESIRLGPAPDATITYALLTVAEYFTQGEAMSVRYQGGEIAVVMDAAKARAWAEGAEVGVYAVLNTGDSQLEVAVEKDFACLDASAPQNHDTYPHPQQGTAC